MSSIDNRIVQMKFDNAGFESGARKTMGTLARLKESLRFSGASKGLNEIKSSASRFNLQGMQGSVTGVSKSFIAMSTVAITALAGITTKAISTGTQLANSLTLKPIMAGFQEYELKMKSIQTILGNTSKYGTKLSDVTKSLADLNTYADKTIYNFADMTRNISLFTNAGIRLEDATSMIKGFSNEAAISGTNAEDAARAAYQLSQALPNGAIKLQDWKSLTNAGMGRQNMRDSLIDIAKALDTFKASGTTAEAAAKNFNGTIAKGWLTTDVMQTYLKAQAGELSKAQLVNIGLSEKQAKAFIKQQKMSEDAATKVRTGTQLLNTLQEAAGSGWSETFEIIVGNFNEATKMWTGASNVFGKMIGASAKSRNDMLKGWRVFGGRDYMIQGISNAFKALMSVVKPIKSALRDIFPPMTGLRLAALTKDFAEFTKKLILGKDTAKKVKAIFKGIFSVFSLVGQVIGEAIGVVKRLFGIFSSGSGGILDAAANFGKFLIKLVDGIKQSGIITTIFTKLGDVLAKAVRWISSFISKFAEFVAAKTPGFIDGLVSAFQNLSPWLDRIKSGFQSMVQWLDGLKDKFLGLFDFGEQASDTAKKIEIVSSSMDGFSSVGNVAKTIWDTVVKAVGGIINALGNAASAIGPTLSHIKSFLGEFFAGMGFQDVLAAINVAYVIAIYATFRKFLGNLSGLVKSYSGMFDNIGGMFNQITGSLKSMQTQIRAKALMEIAAGLALLAAAIFLLSKADPKGLGFALGAMAGLMAGLVATLKGVEAVTKDMGAIQFVVLSAGIVALAFALMALAGAVAIMGRMDPKTLAVGLSAVAVSLTIMVAAVYGLNKSGGSGQLVKAALGIAAISVALYIFSRAISLFANMDLENLKTGGLRIAAALAGIAIAMRLMPSNMLPTGAGLVLLGVSLLLIGNALKRFASMSWGEIGKAAVVFAGVMAILAAASYAMSGSAVGAVGILAVAAAVYLLAPALAMLGKLEMGTIGKGLLAIAGAFAVLILAGAAAYAVAPGLLALGAAIGLIGLGIGAAGAGIFLLAAGLAALAAAGAAGLAVFTGMITSMLNMMPLWVHQFGNVVTAIATMIKNTAPEVTAALMSALQTFLTTLIANGPLLQKQFLTLLKMALETIVQASPMFYQAGITLMTNFINVLANNAQNIATSARKLITSFLTAFDVEIPKIGDKATKLIGTFANNVQNNSSKLATSGRKIIVALINAANTEIPKIVGSASRLITTFLHSVAAKIGPIVRAGANVIVKFLDGLASKMESIIEAGTRVMVKFIDGVTKNSGPLIDAGTRLVGTIIKGVANKVGELLSAGTKMAGDFVGRLCGALRGLASTAANAAADIGRQIISGLKGAIWNGIQGVKSAAASVARAAISAAKSALKINSPSKKFIEIGNSITEGFVVGIDGTSENVKDSLETLLNKLDSMTKNKSKSLAKRAKDAKTLFLKGLTPERNELARLGAQYDALTDQLKEAQDKLDAAIQARDNSYNSLFDQYNVLPGMNDTSEVASRADQYSSAVTIDVDTTVEAYTRAVQEQAKKTKAFMASLAQLKSMGLNETTYQQLLKNGVGVQPFIDELLASGPNAVASLNAATADLDVAAQELATSTVETTVEGYTQKLNEEAGKTQQFIASLQQLVALGLNDAAYQQILKEGLGAQPFINKLLEAGPGAIIALNQATENLRGAAQNLATTGSTELYQAGINAAQGLVDGLKSQQDAVKAQMTEIARAMVKAIKKALKIKSPSRIFAEIGVYSNKGLAEGLRKNIAMTQKSAAYVAKQTAQALKLTLDRMNERATQAFGATPVIAPVLNLDQLRKDASSMISLWTNPSITADVSYKQASLIATIQNETATANKETANSQPVVQEIKFEQNNYSPAALAASDIYRSTKNQLTLAKEALGV